MKYTFIRLSTGSNIIVECSYSNFSYIVLNNKYVELYQIFEIDKKIINMGKISINPIYIVSFEEYNPKSF